MATQNVPHSNPRSRASKSKKDKSKTAVVREVDGKNILFVNDKALAEILQPNFPYYDPGDTAGDIANGMACIAYLLESLSQAGNEEIDGFIACGFSSALRRYSEDVGRYLQPKAGPNPPDSSQLELVPLAVRK
jgi:hypothetical protein